MKIICYHHHLTIILSNWNQFIIIVPDKRLLVDFFIARLIVSSGGKDCIIFALKVWESISDEKKSARFQPLSDVTNLRF